MGLEDHLTDRQVRNIVWKDGEQVAGEWLGLVVTVYPITTVRWAAGVVVRIDSDNLVPADQVEAGEMLPCPAHWTKSPYDWMTGGWRVATPPVIHQVDPLWQLGVSTTTVRSPDRDSAGYKV